MSCDRDVCVYVLSATDGEEREARREEGRGSSTEAPSRTTTVRRGSAAQRSAAEQRESRPQPRVIPIADVPYSTVRTSLTEGEKKGKTARRLLPAGQTATTATPSGGTQRRCLTPSSRSIIFSLASTHKHASRGGPGAVAAWASVGGCSLAMGEVEFGAGNCKLEQDHACVTWASALLCKSTIAVPVRCGT